MAVRLQTRLFRQYRVVLTLNSMAVRGVMGEPCSAFPWSDAPVSVTIRRDILDLRPERRCG